MRDTAILEHKHNIRSGLPILDMKYGLSIDEYDYLEMAVDALKDISHFGLFPMVTYEVVDKDGYVNMPCNMNILEGLGTADHIQKSFRDRKIIQPRKTNSDGYYTAKAIRRSIEWPAYSVNVVDSFISFSYEEDKLKIMEDRYVDEEIGIAFTGYLVDDEGYPIITRKQANAIAAIVARNILMKAALLGDKNKAAMLEIVNKDAVRMKQAASIPEELSDNELDQALDAQTTFNRKMFKRPQKYSR